MKSFRRAACAVVFTVASTTALATPHTDKQRGSIASFIPQIWPETPVEPALQQPEYTPEVAAKKPPEERFGMSLVNEDGQGDFIAQGHHFLTKCMRDSSGQQYQFIGHLQYSFNLSRALNNGVSDDTRENVLERVIDQTRQALEKSHRLNPTPVLISPDYLDGLTRNWKLNTAVAHASDFTNALDAAAGMAVDVQIDNPIISTGRCGPIPNLQVFKQIEAVYQYSWANYMRAQQMEHRVNMR